MPLIFERRHRRDVDDAQRLAIGNAACGKAGGQQPRRVHVHRHHLIVEFGAELVGACGIGNAGIVDQYRHRPHCGFHHFGKSKALRLIRHIDLEGAGGAAGRSDLGNQRVQLVSPARAQRHAGSGHGQHPGKARAQAGRSAGNDGNLAGKIV